MARDQGTIALVRFWKTDLPAFANLRVVVTIPAHKRLTSENLGNGGSGFSFTNYLEVPAGRGSLEVFTGPPPAAGKPEVHPLVSQPVDLTPKKFFTVLVNEPETKVEKLHLEIIADSDQDEKLGTANAQFTVRNFVRNLKGMKVVVGESLNAQFATGTSYLMMRGIRPEACEMRTSGMTADGKPFEWVNEANFSQNLRQTLLVYPDPYGRIRPQLIVDGANAALLAEDPDKQR